MSDHVWVQENLAAYVAGGLSADDAEQIKHHLADCAECAADHEDIRKMEQVMDQLYREQRPDAELEDRVIGKLRTVPPSRPGLKRFFTAAAAVVVLGLLGAAMQAIAANGDLWMPGTRLVKESNVLMGIDLTGGTPLATRSYFGLMEGTSIHGRNLAADGEGFTDKREKAATEMGYDTDIKYNADRIDEFSVPGSVNPNESVGVLQSTTPFSSSPPKGTDPSNSVVGPLGGAAAGGSVGLGTGPMATFGHYATGDSLMKGNQAYSFWIGMNRSDGNSNNKPSDKPIPMPLPSPSTVPGFVRDKGPSEEAQPNAGEKKPLDPPIDNPGLKIIRTGEIEFEVESFDTAIDSVTKLITGVKGGIITKKDSDKLKNGKTFGFIVVRMPPQFLDAFISDLRLALTKTGELKTQRISSQDVTKSYTDNEAALRSARVTEQRYLDIIKNGKGEIKELVIAENALAEWRTKIEKLEGENRFFNNQVSLSTLTIKLAEKEIQTPSALLVSQKIEMNIEVEDVESAYDAALAAITEAKGRVTKSDRKQYPFGHVKAIVHAEASPTAARTLEERLKKLGIVTQQNTQRSQESQGGVGRPLDLKPRLSDVVLEIELYNSANIRPREAIDLQIVTQDVQGNYRKLQETVARLKGQVQDSKLNEQDKRNITAQFDFDIAVQDRQAIDKLLGEIGPVISRGAGQAPPKEIVTDRKIGYRLQLRDVAGMPPREKIALLIEVRDVTAKAAELKELVRAAKGAIVSSKLNHDAKGQTSALLTFDVPLNSNDALVKQIKESGTVRDQRAAQNSQAPENELATAHIEVVLTNAGPIVPSDEGLWNQVRTSLYYSFRIFAWSVSFVILGLSVILPWALLFWAGVKVVRRVWKKPQASAAG